MKTIIEKRLFWFLKEGTELDVSDETHLDMFNQRTLSREKTSDIKKLFKMVPPSDFIQSFNRVKNFLSKEVRRLSEACLGDIDRPAEKGSSKKMQDSEVIERQWFHPYSLGIEKQRRGNGMLDTL